MKPPRELTEEWNEILNAEGLSMWRGRKNLVYEHLLNPHSDEENEGETLHWSDWAALGAPTRGGRLVRYAIGSRVSHLRVCQRCGIHFPSKRRTAKYCSKRCRQRKPTPLPVLCLVCGTPLRAKHRDARYHPECRYRGYRAHVNIDTSARV